MKSANSLSLTSILNEIKREQKRALKNVKRQVYASLSISEIINSGALGKKETYALKMFFKYHNNNTIPLLNENTIKRIDARVYTLNENQLNEGWVDWIKSVGNKAIEWIQSGWEGVKKVWKNFTDVVTQIVDVVKEGLQKLADAVFDKVKSIGSAIQAAFDKQSDESKKHLEQHEPSDIKREWATVKDSVTLLSSYMKKLVSGAMWADQVISGNVAPAGDTSPVKENFKFDKFIIKGLLNLNEGFHMEDLLNKEKYPTVHKVVQWILKAISWVFNPINTALKYLAKFVVGGWSKDGKSGILYWLNLTAEKLGGPTAIAYPVLGFLCMEATEVCLSGMNLATHGKMLGALQVGVDAIDSLGINVWDTLHHLVSLVPGLGTVITIAEWICIIYAIGNFILNVLPQLIAKINPELSADIH